jgi:hypothetical protein
MENVVIAKTEYSAALRAEHNSVLRPVGTLADSDGPIQYVVSRR